MYLICTMNLGHCPSCSRVPLMKSVVWITGGDVKQEGLASYRLGIAHEDIGDAETAILVSWSSPWYPHTCVCHLWLCSCGIWASCFVLYLLILLLCVHSTTMDTWRSASRSLMMLGWDGPAKHLPELLKCKLYCSTCDDQRIQKSTVRCMQNHENV